MWKQRPSVRPSRSISDYNRVRCLRNSVLAFCTTESLPRSVTDSLTVLTDTFAAFCTFFPKIFTKLITEYAYKYRLFVTLRGGGGTVAVYFRDSTNLYP
jgi:hypothetical protein